MFCARCGQQIPDTSALCPLCGREATIKLEPPPVVGQTNVALEPSPLAIPPAASFRNRGLQPVGGWLLFFCIVLVIMGPLSVLAEVMTLSSNGPDTPDITIVVILDLARAALGVATGIVVWNVRPMAFTLLWIYFGLVALLGILGIIGFAMAEQNRPEDLIVSIRSLIYVAIWATYFHRSQRVRATFGRNL